MSDISQKNKTEKKELLKFDVHAMDHIISQNDRQVIHTNSINSKIKSEKSQQLRINIRISHVALLHNTAVAHHSVAAQHAIKQH